MKRKIVAMLLSLCLALMPVMGAMAEEEELFFSGNDLTQDKTESSGSELDNEKNQSASILESLGQKDWNALADAVKLTGDWRDDLVAVAQSQVGYAEESNGMTIYTKAADKKAGTAWTALFINWVAEKADLSSREFPRGDSYKALRSAMNKVKAVKKISRSSYPTAGDLAFIESGSTQLVGIVTYVSNGYASMIVADVNGRVVKDTYAVGKNGFTHYADLNVLMERAGIEVGKGGEVPYIPEGGLAAWTNTNAVYMRSEPTTASSRVTTVKKSGSALVVYSGELQDDGYIWYQVKYNKYSGYIRGDLLALDMEAIQATAPAAPTVTPAPAAPAEPTDEPHCGLCAFEAGSTALPVECCYQHLKAMGEHAAQFMAELQENDAATWQLYVRCHDTHVEWGEEQLIPLGGLSVQERVVNIVVTEPVDANGVSVGQQVTFTFEVYGAKGYQWYQKDPMVLDANGQPVVTMLIGQTGTTLTVTAGAENNGCIYYCEATLADGAAVVTSKPVTLSVAEIKVITADAIIGEKVYFTYNHAGAAGYQWYVKAPDAESFALVADATGAKITLTAELAMSGAVYYAEALDASANVLGQSQQYCYVISTDFAANLCKYVEELANMTRAERYAIMTDAWNITVNGKNLAEQVENYWLVNCKAEYPTLLCTCSPMKSDGEQHWSTCPWKNDATSSANERNSADPCENHNLPAEMLCAYEFLRALDAFEQYEYLAALHAQNANQYGYVISAHDAHVTAGNAAVICNCKNGIFGASHTMKTAPGSSHQATCPWSIAGMAAARASKDADFAAWYPTATEAMIARALTVETLDHIVLEKNADGITYTVYVARYADAVGAVDAQGYMTYGNPALVIAWVDFTTGAIHGVNALPAAAPAYVD